MADDVGQDPGEVPGEVEDGLPPDAAAASDVVPDEPPAEPAGEGGDPMAALEAARSALAAAQARKAMAEAMKRVAQNEANAANAAAASEAAVNASAEAARLQDEPADHGEAYPDSLPSDVEVATPPGGVSRANRPEGRPPASAATPRKGPPPQPRPTAPAQGSDRHRRPTLAPQGASGPGSDRHKKPTLEKPTLEKPASTPARKGPPPASGRGPDESHGHKPEAARKGPPAPTGGKPASAGGESGGRTQNLGAPDKRPPAAKPPTTPAARPATSSPAASAPAAPARPPASSGATARPGATTPGKPERPTGAVLRKVFDPMAAGKPVAPAPSSPPAQPAGRKGTGKHKRPVVPGLDQARKRLRRFQDQGWRCAEGNADSAKRLLAVDLGVEGVCVTSFEGGFAQPRDVAQPTMVVVNDPHAFRTLEPASLGYGVEALDRWPSERVLRGTDGSLLLPSQIGLVEFPADHVLAGLLTKAREERKRQPKDMVLTLPTFLPSDRDDRIRAAVAPWKKGAFRGVPGPIAAAYFYAIPALDHLEARPGEDMVPWAKAAVAAGRILLLGWGASGLEYGLVTLKPATTAAGQTELRLTLAGVWPSLGGHRLTESIVSDLKEMLCERILEQGPSDALLSRALIANNEALEGRIPQPVGYEEAFKQLERLGPGPWLPHEEAQRRRLHNVLFPTQWRFNRGEEPQGYAPYRKLAVQNTRTVWDEAEKIKRMILSDPTKYRQRGTVPWSLDRFESPFTSHLDDRTIPYPVGKFLDRVEVNLAQCLAHIDRRLASRGWRAPMHVGLLGMQSCSPLLPDALATHGKRGDARALAGSSLAPTSSDPLELKAVTNRGAALLARDKKTLDFGPVPDVLPFSVEIADCLGNIAVFTAGPIDELSVFQRRFRVEGGSPHLEFYLYASEDGTQRGTWGACDFSKPFEFSERDQVFAVDPRYGFGSGLPKLADLRPDLGQRLLEKCYERGTSSTDGLINFRAFAPRESEEARRLLHFLENGLGSEFFHRKVYLLEREFAPPPRRFDHIYQRYYLSRSQELIVVREWWAPFEGDRLQRHKTLHTVQGKITANTILGLQWGRV